MAKYPEDWPYTIQFDSRSDYFIHWWYWLWGFIAATIAVLGLLGKILQWIGSKII